MNAVGSNAIVQKYVEARPPSAGCQLRPPFVLLKRRFVVADSSPVIA